MIREKATSLPITIHSLAFKIGNKKPTYAKRAVEHYDAVPTWTPYHNPDPTQHLHSSCSKTSVLLPDAHRV